MCVLIERTGVGDEVLMFVSLVLLAIVIFGLYMWYRGSGSSSSSPSSVEGHGFQDRIRREEYDCCICLDPVRFAVETNCGHVFCGACGMEYYERLNLLTTLTCPYCRQRLTAILPYFTPRETGSLPESEQKERQILVDKIKAFNRRYSNEPRSVWEQVRDFPTLGRRLWNTVWNNSEGADLFFRVRILLVHGAALFYLLCPIDIVPEILFGIFGFIDDVLIVFFVCLYAVNLYRNILAQRGLA